jgi:hypothetical protein
MTKHFELGSLFFDLCAWIGSGVVSSERLV